jgi:Bacterial PH domain
MTRPLHVAREHELEPQYGLPESLPAGEKILWQGSPDAWALARSAFHIGLLALYFGALLVWKAVDLVGSDVPLADWPRAMVWLGLVSLLGLSLVGLLAWLTAKTTVYTLTTQRVVMRIGIVLTVAFNLPLKRIEGAQVHPLRGGKGDIALSLERETRIAWLQLWPHVRPWRVARPQPLLRAVPAAHEVSRLLTQAWSAVNGLPAVVGGGATPGVTAPQHGSSGQPGHPPATRPSLAA